MTSSNVKPSSYEMSVLQWLDSIPKFINFNCSNYLAVCVNRQRLVRNPFVKNPPQWFNNTNHLFGFTNTLSHLSWWYVYIEIAFALVIKYSSLGIHLLSKCFSALLSYIWTSINKDIVFFFTKGISVENRVNQYSEMSNVILKVFAICVGGRIFPLLLWITLMYLFNFSD